MPGKIILKKPAEKNILNLIDFIIDSGYPDNAASYFDKIVLFLERLPSFGKNYSFCKYPPWNKRKWRCAVFDAKYVVAFKPEKDAITVYKFVHGSKLRYH